MSKIKVDISVSLDGFITGPGEGVDIDKLHEWIYGLASWRSMHSLNGGTHSANNEIMAESTQNIGAVIMGRGMFDDGEGPWGDTPPFRMPVYVLTHEVRDPLTKNGGTTFVFVSDGIESTLAQAKAAAGPKDIAIVGGADVIQQYLKAGLIDEMQLHIVPILLGGGIRLFDPFTADPINLKIDRVVHADDVTHIRYRLGK